MLPPTEGSALEVIVTDSGPTISVEDEALTGFTFQNGTGQNLFSI